MTVLPDGSAPAPDRFAHAVRARRVELLAAHERLTGSHRAELRGALALARLAATADAERELAALGVEARARVAAADRAARLRFPAVLAPAVDLAGVRLQRSFVAALRPALRRIATERAAAVAPGWPVLPALRPPRSEVAPPEPVGAARALLAGAVDGAAVWRLAVLPLALLSTVGLSALGNSALGPRLVPLAVGSGITAVVVAAVLRRAATERVRLHRHCADVLDAARAALDVECTRVLLELERVAGPALDTAVQRRRVQVEAELRRLAPAVTGA